eukprot:CAMPEP_0113466164 /NCGR_PEP_ID=MMETSP0014_2-20120614/14125_1 /TAXON_ID=2857 /ORGANISM="Nitzschia sp." /LENGTH=187 /DNA_ID=CAMNT_0000358367 /DNA_START=53 /DNA_END=616 /DNA_ORIENTATION=- /assembly_acc=CAM_ASM_000159
MEPNHATTEDHGQEKGVAEETTKAETSASAAAGGNDTVVAGGTDTASSSPTTTGDHHNEGRVAASGNEEEEGKVTDADIAASIRRDLERARQGLPVDKNKRTTGDNETGEGTAKRNKREYLAFHGTKHTRVGNDYQVDLSKLPAPEPAAAVAPETDPSPAEAPPQPSSAVPSQKDTEEQKKTGGAEE